MLRYMWLEAKRQWRNREILVFRLGIPAAIYLILIAVQDRPGGTEGGVPWQTGRMVALAALAAVMSGLASGPSLGEERGNGWLRQLRVTPLRPSAAVVAKIVVAMSFALPAIALVAAIGGLTADIALTGGQWVQVIGLMWIATASVATVGTLIGLTFGAESAQNATTLAFVILWLLGGIFTSPTNMPDALAAVSRSLPSYGMVEVGWSTAGGEPVPVSAVAVLAAWTAGAGALAALAWRRVMSR
jgi:ABC-2 type transport system permease protein